MWEDKCNIFLDVVLGTSHVAFTTSRSFLTEFGNCPFVRNTSAAFAPDCRDVLGPLSVERLGSLLQLVQLVLDHFSFVAVSTLFCHGLQTQKIQEKYGHDGTANTTVNTVSRLCVTLNASLPLPCLWAAVFSSWRNSEVLFWTGPSLSQSAAC